MLDLYREDQLGRQRALDTRASLIVQAPAGSGKTTLLMNRYLALLAHVEQPEEVLAITFTRKATSELRDRVLAALAAPGKSDGLPAHLAQTMRLAERVRQRDSELGWGVEQQPDRLRIQTIDALCAGLSTQLPWQTQFGGDISPVDDAEPLYKEAAQGVLECLDDPDWGDAVAQVFAHLDNDVLRFQRLLVEMLGKRDQWLPHIFALADEPARQRAELEGALARAVELELIRLKAAIPRNDEGEVLAIANQAARNCRDHSRDSPVVACLDLAELPEIDGAALAAWQGIAHLFLTMKGTWRVQHTINDGFPSGRAAADADLKARAKALVGRWQGNDELRGLLNAVRTLPRAEFSNPQWQVLQALTDVLRLAAGLLRVGFRRQGNVDFIELTTAAREALGSFAQPGELALALDYRIQHILVDEYQDTSKSHQQVLDGLTAGWEPGDGRTLFLVGDPMQSIYRFREAEVGLFLRAQSAGLAHVALEPLVLHANYRSVAALITWYNNTFARLFPIRNDVATGAVEYRASVPVTETREAGGARLHALSDAREPQLVCALIAEARAQGPGDSIAILVRSRTHLTAILPALDAAGIGYRGVDIAPLGEVQVVQDLLSIARALLHPADRVAWLAVLRAPWCGLTLADLNALVEGAPQSSIESLLRDPARLALLGDDGRVRAVRTFAVLRDALAQRSAQSLRRRVESTWLRLAGPACVGEVQLVQAQAFFALLDSWEARGLDLDPDSLRDQLQKFYAPSPGRTGDVEVMTMHKAKGLEFDHVILPGLERTGRRSTRPLMAWSEQIYAGGDTELLLAPMPRDESDDLPAYDYIHGLDRHKQDLELDRLLYVAATRARRHLHLIATCRRDADGVVVAPRAGSLLRRLWPQAAQEFAQESSWAESHMAGASATVEQRGVADDRAAPGFHRLPSDWQPPPPPADVGWDAGDTLAAGSAKPDAIEFDWAGFAARQLGILAHRVLKDIAEQGLSAWDAERLDARQHRWCAVLGSQGVPLNQLTDAVARLQRALLSMLEQPQAQWIFAPHDEARNEYALTGVVAGELRRVVIDRTFVDQLGTRWIIDYKTGGHEGADVEAFLDREQERYQSQLEGYAALLEQFDGRPIRLGLYFPLLNGWREWSR